MPLELNQISLMIVLFHSMNCSKCGHTAVIFIRYNGRYLCLQHFIEFLERRVKKEIRKQGLPKGHIAVALSGGKDSIVTCYLLNKILHKENGHSLTAISIDEGLNGYRKETIKIAKKANYNTIISGRSGESEDTFLAHLFIGLGVNEGKIAGLRGAESTSTLNELIRIEETLVNNFKYLWLSK